MTGTPLTGTPRVAVEICVDDVDGAVLAEEAGADRIELCAGLSEGGVTPSIGLVATVLARVKRIGVQIMVRPRGGDFEVSPDELAVMLADIAAFRSLPAPATVRIGFVFGVLTPGRDIDRDAMSRLLAACGPAPITCHKAFDLARDRAAALDILASLGIGRVLTSGGAPSAESGTAALAALVRRSAGRVAIVAGGGVRAHNVRGIVAASGVREVHLRATRDRPGKPPATSRDEIAAVRQAVGMASS